MKHQYSIVVSFYLLWISTLFAVIAISPKFLPLQKNFLGGGLKHYLANPYLWAWANFDGEHYLAIAREGYKPLTHFFFPFYPLLIDKTSELIGNSYENLALEGVLISQFFFFLALLGIWKLIKKDYSQKLAITTIILILLFPTSFYFGTVYTESLFLALSVWSLYLARNKKWLLASILAAFASATKVVGIILLPTLLMEWWTQYRTNLRSGIVPLGMLLISPLGLLGYMYFLEKTTGDPLIFLHTVEMFGDQRSSHLILLPQVFYRYVFKVLPNLTLYWPILFTTLLEIVVGVLFLVFLIVGFWRMRASYWVFLAGTYIIPTLSGSFSSMPRYVLIIFPAFVLFAYGVEKAPRLVKYLVFFFSYLGLLVASSLFFSGYWVS